MKIPVSIRCLGFVVLSLALPTVSQAVWPQDGAGIGVALGHQSVPATIPDGAGGAFITWEDFRTGQYIVYVQRVDALGVALWAANGVAISNSGADRDPAITSDGAGGAIIAWSRSNDIYAQRVNSSGVVQWTAGGVAVSTAAGAQQLPSIGRSSEGGAIIAWQDSRTGIYDIYVRLISSSGVPQWAPDGVAICTAIDSQTAPRLVTDNSGGAEITWQDNRVGSSDIYAQRVANNGVVAWAANGVALCTAANSQGDPQPAPDGTGGIIVAWSDNRAAQYDIYAQRINNGGAAVWAANGVAVAGLADFQWNAAIMADGLGGAFIAWEDTRAAGPGIYAQRVSTLGAAQWTANGVSLGGVPKFLSDLAMVTDGLGGAIVAWTDQRTGFGNTDIYARRINGSGVPQWSAGGTALCTVIGTQDAVAMASDGAGGAIVVWEDERASISINDVYAQRIERNGQWGYPSPAIAYVRDIPGDQGGLVNLSWNASRLDPWPDELIDNYTVWRAINPTSAAAAMQAGAVRVRDGIDPMPSGKRDVIRVQETAAATYFWTLIHTVNAYGLTGYADQVPTLFDSTATSAGPHYFQVIAHAGSAQWISEPASGKSLDNLAPLPPLQLIAQRVGSDVHLIWNKNQEPDLDQYQVYRHTSTGVTPVPPYFLSSADDTVLVDQSAPGSSLYYIVTAVDVHDNQSAQSNEANVSPVTGVGDTPSIARFTVLPNYPNPFAETTALEIGLPAAGAVTIEIFDVAGRRVRDLKVAGAKAGWQSVVFDGRDGAGTMLSSGVYFCRVRANGETITRKMVISR